MSQDCRNNILRRDGTSQEQRLVNALLPSYVQVDERKMEDLKSFVLKYTAEIKYYNVSNQADGNWTGFFEKEIDNNQLTEPHYALFLAFLKLFKFAQDDVNRITETHLNFYYKDVLGLKEHPPVADQVFLIFHLAKHVNAHEISSGTLLKAGKDALGNNLLYAMEDTLAANKAQADLFQALNVAPATDATNYAQVFYSPVANSADGIGGELISEDKRWETFGMPDGVTPRPLADIGFAAASPLLFMAEGTRKVTITVSFKNSTFANMPLPDNMFSVLFSGEKAWIEGSLPLTATTLDSALGPLALDQINSASSAEDVQALLGQSMFITDLSSRLLAQKRRRSLTTPSQLLDFITNYTLSRTILADSRLNAPATAKTAMGLPSGISRKKAELLLQDNYFASSEDFIRFIKNNNLASYLTGSGLGAELTAAASGDKSASGSGTDINTLYNSIRSSQEASIASNMAGILQAAEVTTGFDAGGNLVIIRTIAETEKAVVAYNREVLKDPFLTSWPVLKALLRQENTPADKSYEVLKGLIVQNVNIKVEVTGIKNLIVQNDNALLNASKPFVPFSPTPEVGSVFYVGSWEIFQKKLDSLTINATWQGLPPNYSGYYNYYLDGATTGSGNKRNDWGFSTNVQVLDKKIWKDVSSGFPLFPAKDSTTVQDNQQYIFTGSNFSNIDRDEKLNALTEYNVDQVKGFIRFQLLDPDFGHKDYGKSYATRLLTISNNISHGGTTDFALPNEPYTPKIKAITADYSSNVTIDLSLGSGSNALGNGIDQFFQVAPTGVAEKTDATIKSASSSSPNIPMFPQFDKEGNLYIGISQLVPAQNLSLLFKVAEGTADPRLPKEEVLWSYLSNNEWKNFDKQEVLKDTTQGLLTSGIVTFAVPKTATNNNTLMPAGYHWIRAAVQQNAGAVCDMIFIGAQAVTAVFTDRGNDPQHLASPLPAGSVKKLNESDSAVTKIDQPYTSFGGSMQEDSNHFFLRVSERLRHKNRSITLWDYEHIILEAFPSVYKVKCLNHTIFDGDPATYSEVAPGHVSLVVVPDVINSNAVDPLRPLTSKITIEEILQHLEKIKSYSATLHIQNPLYEEIMVDFNVKFIEGADEGISLQKLNDAIKRFLSPWAYDEEVKLTFEKTVHRSVILTFVENQDYVDYVTCFRMYHKVPGETEFSGDVEEVQPSTGASVLGSADSHIITPINSTSPDACDCEDNIVTEEGGLMPADVCPCDDAGDTGLGGVEGMIIGKDFVV